MAPACARARPGPSWPGPVRSPAGTPATTTTTTDDYYEDEPRRIPKFRVLVAAVVLAVIAAGGGAFLGLRNGGGKPYWVAEPPGSASVAPVLGGLGANARQPTPATLAALLTPMLADSRLGPRVSASVVDVASGQSLFDSGSTIGTRPRLDREADHGRGRAARPRPGVPDPDPGGRRGQLRARS